MSERRAWGWASALRAGSTTRWLDWPERDGDGEPFADRLPGAQQLAVLRRLNLAAAEAGSVVPRATADRVLAAGLSGRGRPDLPLLGVPADERFGSRPVDPDVLPEGELLRVAVGLVADDLAGWADVPAPERSLVEKVQQVRLPWARAFVVVGVQWRADAVRAGLLERGLRPGGRRPTAYLLADDLATVLRHAWTARAFDQGGPGWADFVRTFAVSGHLPPRADLPRMARAAAGRFGADRVTVVLDPDRLADELGVPELAEPPRLGAHAVDLVRRVGEPLGLLVAAPERPRLLRELLAPRLAGPGGGPEVSIPRRWETWLATQAERTHHEIAAAGYPVLGDLDRLLPGPLAADPVLPVDAEVLALALGLLLDPLPAPPGPTANSGPSVPTDARRQAP